MKKVMPALMVLIVLAAGTGEIELVK